MRVSVRSGYLAIIVIGALVISAAAAPSSPSMGVVLQASDASLSGSTVITGATIFNGDTLSTDKAGMLRARFGSSQVYLYPSSVISVGQVSNGFNANLMGGTVLLSSGANGTYQVQADGAILRPAGNQPSVAQISWVSPTELLLTSQKGDLSVTMGDETQTVSQGASYRMMIVPASQPAASPAAPAATTGVSHFYFIAIGVILLLTIIAAIIACESPSNLKATVQ